MRETERLIEVDKVIKEEVLLNKEEITSYAVDKRNQRITIELQLSGDDTRYVETEVHRFFSGQFINEPTEEDLWELIDEKKERYLMAVDPNIKKKADDIRNKIYGKEVRESLASGLEAMSSDVVKNEGRQSVVEGRQDSVESQWQAVSDEMTDKDVISAPEIIAARNGEANLKTRIDKDHQEVTAQLAQTTNKVGVSFEEFGAKLDGITDDTEAIKDTFAYANEHQIPVIQRHSTFVLNDEIEVRVDVDLKGSVVKTTMQDSAQYEYFRTSYLFKIVGEPLENITSSLERSQFTKGNTRIPSLANVESGTLIIQTQDFDMNRIQGNNLAPINKQEVNMVIKNPYGDLAYPLTKDFSNSLGFTVHHRKNEPKLTFIAPTVHVDNANIYSIVRVERNNVDVIGGSILDTRGGTISPVYTFTSFHKCSQVKTDGLNVSLIGRKQKTGENGLGYVLLYYFVADIQVRNTYQVDGWHGLDGNNFRDIYVENSKLLTIGGHQNTYDLRIGSNTTVYRCVTAQGGGVLEVDGLTVINGLRDDPFVDTPDMTSRQLSNPAVVIRSDYGSEWDGVIKIKDLTTIHPTIAVQVPRVNNNFGRKSILPRVEVDKLTIVNPLGNTTVAVRWDTMNNNPVGLPSFDIKNVKVLSKSRHRTISIPDITVPDGDTSSEGGTIHVEIENCNPPLETFSDDTFDVENTNIRLPYITNDNFRIKMSVRNSLCNIEFAGSSNMDIDVFESDVYVLRNGHAGAFTLNGYKTNVNLINCNIHKPSSNLNPTNNKDRFNFTVRNSVWKRFDGGYNPNQLGGEMADLIRFSSNNIAENLEGISIANRLKMFDYIDTDHWINS